MFFGKIVDWLQRLGDGRHRGGISVSMVRAAASEFTAAVDDCYRQAWETGNLQDMETLALLARRTQDELEVYCGPWPPPHGGESDKRGI